MQLRKAWPGTAPSVRSKANVSAEMIAEKESAGAALVDAGREVAAAGRLVSRDGDSRDSTLAPVPVGAVSGRRDEGEVHEFSARLCVGIIKNLQALLSCLSRVYAGTSLFESAKAGL
jgi:hypothetical protein